MRRRSLTFAGVFIGGAEMGSNVVSSVMIPELFSVRDKVVLITGAGGMGEVFLAYDLKMDRRIALKRIKPNLFSSKKACQRFLQEAIISGKLTHPSIIPIYSIYQEENNLYYTMPFIEGLTLKQII